MLPIVSPLSNYFLHTIICSNKGSIIIYLVQQHHSLIQQQHDQNIQKHHQNIQMLTHNLMRKKILASMGVSVPLNIPEVPDIPFVTNFSKT